MNAKLILFFTSASLIACNGESDFYTVEYEQAGLNVAVHNSFLLNERIFLPGEKSVIVFNDSTNTRRDSAGKEISKKLRDNIEEAESFRVRIYQDGKWNLLTTGMFMARKTDTAVKYTIPDTMKPDFKIKYLLFLPHEASTVTEVLKNGYRFLRYSHLNPAGVESVWYAGMTKSHWLLFEFRTGDRNHEELFKEMWSRTSFQ